MPAMMLEKVLRWIVLTGIFVLPFIVLIVAQSLFFPYITGKNFAFRYIVEIITGAWLALALVQEKYRPRQSWILGAFAVFVLIMAIADAQGANPFKSFWSNYERMDGWVTLIHVFAYTVVAASVINSEKIWRLLFQVSLGVSVFAGMYGFFQLAGYTALGEGGQAGLSARIDGTFGNPIYLAVYMLFHVFIAALLWYQMWMVRRRGERLASSLAYGAIILLDSLVLFFTGTRGTILGLIGGALISALTLVLCTRDSRFIRKAAISFVVGIIVLAGGFWTIRDAALVHKIGFLDRLATISLSDATTKSRLLNMGIAWQGVKERPVFGWGQENYAIVFDKYYDPRMYAQEPWFDRVHDVFFDWLVTGGFLGLFGYLSIFAAAVWALWRRNVFSIEERAILTGLLAGYFFHNIFVFDNVTSYILFAMMLAYIVWRSAQADKTESIFSKQILPENTLPFVATCAVVFVWGCAWFTNSNALAANRSLLQALAPQQGGIEANLAAMKRTLAYRTYGTQEAREQLSQISVQLASAQNVSKDVQQQFFNLAVSEMHEQEKVSPLDARFPLFLGVLFDAYGDYKDAQISLTRSLSLAPKKQMILYELASNAEARGDSAGATQFYKTALDLEPSNTQARLMYAEKVIRAGNDTLGDQLLAPIIPTGAAASPRIAAAYVSRGEYTKIVTIWQAYTTVNPTDAQGFFTLAAANYANGNQAAAIEALESAKKVQPSIVPQADALIEQVRKGTAKLN